jgi:hypothetical protein
MSTDMCAAALDYAKRGWEVFPAKSDGSKKSEKSAKFSNGHRWGKSVDPAEIRANYENWPNANIGIATGAETGFFVVEADTRKGHNVDGIASLRKLEVDHGTLPKTLMAESPTGSLHYYFRWPPTAIRNSASRIGPGIDVRGEGGMVIAPPSIRSGVGQYRWLNQNAIADAPAWLVALAKANDTDTPHVPNKECEAELELLFAALAAIPNDDVDWETWNVVGMAIWRASGGAGFSVFDTWSQKCGKYDARKTAEKWAEYFKCPPTQIGVGSIIYWANKLSPKWAEEYWRKVEEIFTTPNDPETVRRQIAWMKKNVWKVASC